ncbi:hypothetical protein F8M41_022837 [Gigaspora margarita]|uniref:Uncharacterized protein n=1 Tax=Gigaspora margarita TaxID=4874 RepID=A0A8H4ETG7_GIGMA|nr:hypothetical protein F8M41_022837 [Gigaspora margarita]
MQDKSLEGETFKPIEDEFKNIKYVKVDLVKRKTVEFVQSEHVDVKLVESKVVKDKTQKSKDIEIDQG